MTLLQKKVKKELAGCKGVRPSKENRYYPITIRFGDRYIPYNESYGPAEVSYLLRKFPPNRMYKHKDSCVSYCPVNKPEKGRGTTLKVIEVNPILLLCDGLGSYTYTLRWFTKIKNVYYEILVIINYGSEFVTITHKYNDSRQLPKYTNFNTTTVFGLKAIKYYGGTGDYMTPFKCEVIDIKNNKFFIK